MRRMLGGLIVAVTALAASPASAEIKLTMTDGKVSLSASDVTLGQIMMEWARVGQTRVVNVDRVSGGLMTIELTNVPEVQALDILLRNAGGYLLAPRPTRSPAASVYDRIVIFAVSSSPRPVAAPPPQIVATPPVFPQPRLAPPAPRPPEPRDATEPAVDQPAEPARTQRPPAFSTFPVAETAPGSAPAPPPGFMAPGFTAPSTGTFSVPAGSLIPGMIVPAPQQPQPGQPPSNQPQPQPVQ